MTVPGYVLFHVVFLVPPITTLLLIVRKRTTPAHASSGIALLAGIALVYTIPWDNYLIAHGVWRYMPSAVVGRIGYTPVSEYAFFVLQPVLTGLWFHTLGARIDSTVSTSFSIRVAGSVVWLVVAVFGGLLLTADSGYYLGAILLWASPVLALQWGVGGPALVRHRQLITVAVLVPTLYLWIADRIAIAAGLWELSPVFTTGRTVPVLGLPIEEAAFFLVTNLLVVQGLVLFHWVLAVVAEGTVADGVRALVPASRVIARWR